MPLPSNSSISLQGHSRPGEGVTTKPKVAMLVRMTEETLDALQNLSSADRMEFDFGDRPGIIIRDKSFPMRYNKENNSQELFIRTTVPSRANSNAPLRLNANVVGKFVVERDLSDKLVQQIHNATAAANKQKAERKTIMLDAPPVNSSATQKSAAKRKAPPKSAPRSTPTIVKSYATATPPQPTATSSASSPSTALPREVAALFRQRLIHYLALGSATQSDIVKNVGGVEADRDTRANIMEILNEAAEQEQVARKAALPDTKWRLKPRTWLDVRPYQYQDYTDNVRTSVARSARTWLSTLKIPATDAAWEHVKYRSNNAAGTSSAPGATQRAVNGTSTAAAKAKAKTKEVRAKEAKAKDFEVKAKSEAIALEARAGAPSAGPSRPHPPLPSAAASSRDGKEQEGEKEEGELSASQTPPRTSTLPPVRRLPGSRPSGSSTPTMPPPSQTPQSNLSSQSASAAPPKRNGPVDARGPKRTPPEPSERARAAPPIAPPAPIDRKLPPQVKKERVPATATANKIAVSGGSTLTPRERETLKKERDREKESDRESVRGMRRERDRESDRESIRGRERDTGKERVERERERAPKEREREPKDREKEKERERGKPREKGKEREQPSSSLTAKVVAKRKLAEYSDSESSDWGYADRKSAQKSLPASAGSTKVKRERDSVPAKASISALKTMRRESSPLKKVKREYSPIPPSKTAPGLSQKAPVGAGSSSLSSAPRLGKKDPKAERDREGSTRPVVAKPLKKRRSPIYTSSSDDDEEVKPKRTKVTTKAPPVPSQAHPPKHSTPTAHAPRPRVSQPLPATTKHESLRSRYSNTYSEYLLAFSKLVAQKNKLSAMLQRGSSSGSGDSDGDVDMLSIEELEELSARHQRLHNELETIKQNYMACN
ncbi:hypothetical protein DFH11DRAFT_1562832 [Phellopilus nigrolimitatus]|nr:hypothetical protein DFH11DRAFT_1562832 [Phellopilus nigrolimitatus]